MQTGSSIKWIYGINPVMEAIKAGRDIKELYVSHGRHEKIRDVWRAADDKGIIVRVTGSDFFDNKFPKGHQGVAARVLQKNLVDIDELLACNDKTGVPLFVVLDCIEDPRNFGAILRTADAAGAGGVVIQSRRSAGPGPEAAKTSAGAIEYVPVAVVPNIKHAIGKMKEEGILIVGAESSAPLTVWEADLSVPLAVVIGSEGKGLRKTVRENCDIVVSIPLEGKINSLNVSVATGVLLFEILRQRSIKDEKK